MLELSCHCTSYAMINSYMLFEQLIILSKCLPSFPLFSDSDQKVELSCTWKDILEIRRVIYESVARLCYALKHLHWDIITSLAITTTKASTRPTSGTHSFLVVCASCTLGRLSACNSAHQLKKHQNRRLPASDEWDSVRGQRLRTGWRPARRGKEGVPGRCARWTESRDNETCGSTWHTDYKKKVYERGGPALIMLLLWLCCDHFLFKMFHWWLGKAKQWRQGNHP